MRIGMRIGIGSLVALSVVITGATLSVIVASQSEATVRWVNHTRDVIDCIARVSADLVHAESGTRGFVIAGQPSLLEPSEQARERWPEDIAQLQRLVSDNPRQLDLASSWT